jgi:hypothetical protein
MHSVGRCRGVEDVIVAEDFTFAAASVMGDDVTGLRFPTCGSVDSLTFSSHVSSRIVCCEGLYLANTSARQRFLRLGDRRED